LSQTNLEGGALLRVEVVLAGSSGEALACEHELVLPFERRSVSRQKTVTDGGQGLAIFLARGTVLRDGDVLLAQDGSKILVRAAPEAVMVVRADHPHGLLRAAYHLGNRHIPVEVRPEYLKLEYDYVLADMLRGLGAHVEEALLPFEPEAGAYGGGHHHAH
jgi:urease accessory protein